MQRSWDTIREILLEIEKLEPNQELSLGDFDSERAFEISYHIQLLEQVGLINVTISRTLSRNAKNFSARSLTWSGHEFLDSIRVKDTWSKIKGIISEKGGVMTFDVIKAVATGLIKSAIA